MPLWNFILASSHKPTMVGTVALQPEAGVEAGHYNLLPHEERPVQRPAIADRTSIDVARGQPGAQRRARHNRAQAAAKGSSRQTT